jgi:hypothetical protein
MSDPTKNQNRRPRDDVNTSAPAGSPSTARGLSRASPGCRGVMLL